MSNAETNTRHENVESLFTAPLSSLSQHLQMLLHAAADASVRGAENEDQDEVPDSSPFAGNNEAKMAMVKRRLKKKKKKYNLTGIQKSRHKIEETIGTIDLLSGDVGQIGADLMRLEDEEGMNDNMADAVRELHVIMGKFDYYRKLMEMGGFSSLKLKLIQKAIVRRQADIKRIRSNVLVPGKGKQKELVTNVGYEKDRHA